MIKSVIFGIITIFAAIIVIVITKIGIAKLIENLIYFSGPAITLTVLAASLFIFFVFFAHRFFSWYHNEPRNSGRNAWRISPAQSLNIISGVAAVVVILDSSETVLSLAAQINEGLFWLICPMFIILLFFSAIQQGRIEKRSNRNRTNWWRG